MSVEDLIALLQKVPPHYEACAFVPGIEITDFESPVVDVIDDMGQKKALLEFQPRPGLQKLR